jgi:hypothetical protein
MAGAPPAASTATIIAKLRGWLFETDAYESLMAWARAHVDRVAPGDGADGGHTLAHTALHAEYEAFLESKLEKFMMDAAGATPEEVHAALADALAAAPSGDEAAAINFIVAASEFDTFMGLMRDTAAQVAMEAAAAAAEAGGGGGGGADGGAS